jgi:uncharacterized protein DUF4209
VPLKFRNAVATERHAKSFETVEMENSLPLSASEIPEQDLELPIRVAEPHCSSFFLEYEKAYGQVQDTNPLLGRTYQTLAVLTSFWPNFDSPAEPYGPISRFGERRSQVPDDLTEDDLGVLPVLLEKLTEPALRARILDVLWIRRKDFKAALQAVEAYIMAAEKLFETEAWVYGVECLRRAFQLATSLGRSNDAYQKTETAFEKILGKPIEKIHLNFANHLLGLAAEFRLPDPAKFAAIAAGHGEACLKAGEFEFARQYYKLAAGFFNFAGDQQLTRTQMLRVADLLEEEADNLLKGKTAGAMAAVTFLKQALEINRQFKAEQAKIESVREKLRQAQAVSLDHFQEFRFETNVADLQRKAETEVSGMEFEKAILGLAYIAELTDPQDAIEEQKEQAKKAPLLHLVSTEILDEEGKTIEKIEGFGGSDSEEEDLEKKAFQWAANLAWTLRVQAAIEPARAKIVYEHAPRPFQLEFLVRANPFIQSNHAWIFLRGLHSGLMGDMMIAVHLLVPQLESALRFVLNQHGIDTGNIDSERLEQNKALGKLPEFPELRQLLGDNLIFELRGVFCEKSGFNFRNRLAHGRVSKADCSSVAAVNAWWLILRICCAFYLLTRGVKESGR